VDDEMKLYLGVAQDIVVKRMIERNESRRIAGNLYDREMIVKYEIENFKDKPVTLDVRENLRAIRNQQRGGDQDAEKSTHDHLVFHANLPARAADGKAEKIVHKLHFVLKNEW
jgi:hypothetical protein